MPIHPKLLLTAVATLSVTLSATSHAAILPYTADADTAALYQFDNTTGEISTGSYITDSSSNGLDLRSNSGDTALSPFEGVAGPTGLGTAATFASTNARAFRFGPNDIGSSLSFDTFTIEAWVRNPTGTNPTIFYTQDAGQSQRVFFRLNTNASGSAVQLIYNNAGTGTTSLTSATRTQLATDTWYHVAVTYDDLGSATADDSVVEFFLTPFSSPTAISVGSVSGVADLKALSGSSELLEVGSAGGNNELNGDLDSLRYSNVVRDSFNLIPEPGSLSLIALGGALLVRRSTRR